MRSLILLFSTCLLTAFTITQAQLVFEDEDYHQASLVFEDGGYYEALPDKITTITNSEFPNHYPNETSRQTKVRAPFDHKIRFTCTVNIEGTSKGINEQCEDFNAVYLLLDGTTYINRTSLTDEFSEVVKICGSYTHTGVSLYNTLMIAHLSMLGPSKRSGNWTCQVEAIKKGLECSCGLTSVNSVAVESRILGGTPARSGDYPSMVYILYILNGVRRYGGGTIIGSNVILTAAHLLQEGADAIKNLRVHVGRYNITKDSWDDTIYSEVFTVKSIKKHPQYSILRDKRLIPDANDLAILYTDQYLPQSRGCGPVCLPNPDKKREEYENQDLTALGWGRFEGGKASDILRKGVIQLQQCTIANLPLNKVCGRIDNALADTSKGDSGGPVLYFNPATETHVLVAVTQSGIDCKLSYYEWIPGHMQWILRELGPTFQLCFSN